MVIYEKPKYIWEKYYLTALDFFKALDEKQKKHINKIVDFEVIYSEIMKGKKLLETQFLIHYDTIEKLHDEDWHNFVDYDTLMSGEVIEIDSDLMAWLIIRLKGTYDYEWVFGDYEEYDRYTGTRLKNLYRESNGWHIRLMKEGDDN